MAESYKEINAKLVKYEYQEKKIDFLKDRKFSYVNIEVKAEMLIYQTILGTLYDVRDEMWSFEIHSIDEKEII